MSPLTRAIIIMLGENVDQTSPAFERAANLLELASVEADGWTKRSDDDKRIPDMLRDSVRELRQCALTLDIKTAKG